MAKLGVRPRVGLWSSQDSVDTASSRLVGRFELFRTDTTQVAVTLRSIVEGLDVVGEVCDREVRILVNVLLDPVLSQD
jgi:hypothetical protein